VIFRLRTSSVSVIARQSPYGRRDLADSTAIRPFRARYVMFGPPVLADCYTRPRGAVVPRSSTPFTLVYSTEIWPTFKKISSASRPNMRNREMSYRTFLNGSATLTTNISRTKCCCAAIIGSLIGSYNLYKSKSKHKCLLTKFRHQGATKATQMPIFQKYQKIVKRNHSSDPQMSFCQSIVLINIHLPAKKLKKYCAVFEKQRVVATLFAPTFFRKVWGFMCALRLIWYNSRSPTRWSILNIVTSQGAEK
jgi:hypothetical protein